MLVRSACGFGAVIALSVSLYAQGRSPAPAPTPTNTGTGTPSTGNPNSFPTSNPNTTTNPSGNMGVDRPIFLSGRVMLDDGTAPPESVSIQRICGSNPHTEAYTDGKGRFSFQLGQRLGVLPDASETTTRGSGMGGMGSGMGNVGQTGAMGSMQRENSSTALMGCSLRASLAGYRSDTVDLTNHRSLESPDVGTIILHRVGSVQGQTISATSALAPKDAKKAFEKAQNDKKKDKLEDAQKELVKATTIYPKYAAAWYELGLLQEQSKNDEDAKKSYAQALAADSRYVNPYAQLAGIAVRQPCGGKAAVPQQASVASQVTLGDAAPATMTCEQKWKEAKETTDRLLALDPVNFPEMWFYNAVANYQLKNFEAAEKSARSGLKVDTDHVKPQMNQLLAVLLASKEDYAGAAESLKTYLQIAPNGPEAATVKKQLAQIEAKLQPDATAKKEEKQ
jgi:tetratricopeptide (TPR) repeat protein